MYLLKKIFVGEVNCLVDLDGFQAKGHVEINNDAWGGVWFYNGNFLTSDKYKHDFLIVNYANSFDIKDGKLQFDCSDSAEEVEGYILFITSGSRKIDIETTAEILLNKNNDYVVCLKEGEEIRINNEMYLVKNHKLFMTVN